MSGKDDNDDKDKKNGPSFPEGYEYFDDLIKERLNRRKEIDKELYAASKDSSKRKAHAPKYTPPGFITGRLSGNKALYVQKLEAERAQIETDINKRIEWEMQTIGTDPETTTQIRRTVMDKLYPNLFEGKGEKELNRLGKMEKDMNTSQDYMLIQMKNYRDRQEKAIPISDEPKVEVKGEIKDKVNGSMSISQRFSQSLSYTKAVEKSAVKSAPMKTKLEKLPVKD